MKNMENDKSPGNNGLTKKFYVTFWDDIKATFISSLKKAKERTELSISQRLAIYKLLITKNRILQTENFRYRVRLGLQRVFNLQTKGMGGWFYS